MGFRSVRLFTRTCRSITACYHLGKMRTVQTTTGVVRLSIYVRLLAWNVTIKYLHLTAVIDIQTIILTSLDGISSS